MAGIGFRLEKILSKNSYGNLIEGYAYSAVVSAGPLLCTIFTIAALTVIMPGTIPPDELLTFRTLVVYIYAASLITTSTAQMIITRYIADKIFIHDYRALVPAFVGIVCVSLVVHAVIGGIASYYLNLGPAMEITAVILFLTISVIWIAMIVLSAAKVFIWIVKSFLIGSLVSIGAGYLMGNYLGMIGLLAGFTIGQVVLVVMLLTQIFIEFDYRPRVEFYFAAYYRQYTSLAFIATFYNIGIWADKFVFWSRPETREPVHAFLYASSVYDVPIFVAYLLVVPSLAMFTIRIETTFYVHYKKFFLAILHKHPLSSLYERRENIVNAIRLGMGRLIVMQGTVTIIGIFLAPKLYSYFGMTSLNLGVLQIGMLATFLQALLQTLLIIMLYFDFRIDALIMTAVFALSNALLSMLTIKLGFSYYGYGYFGSCLLTLVAGYVLFNYRLKHLLFYSFVSQKIIVHRDALTA